MVNLKVRVAVDADNRGRKDDSIDRVVTCTAAIFYERGGSIGCVVDDHDVDSKI